jgi:5-methylcytosine-specific restriction endonuclease McrA
MACEYCGKRCLIYPYRITTFRYCSHSCRAKALCVGKTIAIKQEKRSTRITPYERPIYRKMIGNIRARDNYTCQICGKSFEKGGCRLEVDHKIPIRLGGLDTQENLWTLCVSCHRKKDYALRSKVPLSEVNYALEN